MEGYERIDRFYVEIRNDLPKQQYREKPLRLCDVRGESSKAIFKFMTTIPDYIHISEHKYSHPYDVDDWIRNRALLLWYPEWKDRLKDMSIISDRWKNLVENWNTIEKLYDEDYIKYGDGNIYNKDCCSYIRSLVK